MKSHKNIDNYVRKCAKNCARFVGLSMPRTRAPHNSIVIVITGANMAYA